jgi:hypothetical protein
MVDQRFEECNIPEGSLLAKWVCETCIEDAGGEDASRLRR